MIDRVHMCMAFLQLVDSRKDADARPALDAWGAPSDGAHECSGHILRESRMIQGHRTGDAQRLDAQRSLRLWRCYARADTQYTSALEKSALLDFKGWENNDPLNRAVLFTKHMAPSIGEKDPRHTLAFDGPCRIGKPSRPSKNVSGGCPKKTHLCDRIKTGRLRRRSDK